LPSRGGDALHVLLAVVIPGLSGIIAILAFIPGATASSCRGVRDVRDDVASLILRVLEEPVERLRLGHGHPRCGRGPRTDKDESSAGRRKVLFVRDGRSLNPTPAGAMAMLDPKLEVHTASHDVLELPGAKSEAGKREARASDQGERKGPHGT
jgi:hypothetical protein